MLVDSLQRKRVYLSKADWRDIAKAVALDVSTDERDDVIHRTTGCSWQSEADECSSLGCILYFLKYKMLKNRPANGFIDVNGTPRDSIFPGAAAMVDFTQK